MRAYALPAAVPAVIALPAVRAYRRPAARRAQRPPTTVRTRASACAPLTPPLTIDAAQSARTPPRAVLAKRGTAAIPALRDPATVRRAYPLPAAVPAGVSLASVGAYRAAAAVLASVSQPAVRADGFPAAVHAGGAPAAVGAYPGPAALRARAALAIVLAHRDSAALDAQVPVTTVRTGAARLALGPACRARWSQDTGGEVWCERDAGYPRKELTHGSNGKPRVRCACFPDEGFSDNRQLYPGCASNARRCAT